MEIKIRTDKVTLDGTLDIPERAESIVLFAHGSGSGRFSPRNKFVAKALNKSGFATLLMDLLTKDEEAIDDVTRELRFNIELLARRLVGATDWVKKEAMTRDLRLGYFGASTGAAAALVAAVERSDSVVAIVSRGGRPDLAGKALMLVNAPTLLIVGGNDFPVIDINRASLKKLKSKKGLIIIPGATHLFEEPGALEEVARYAKDWFKDYLGLGTL